MEPYCMHVFVSFSFSQKYCFKTQPCYWILIQLNSFICFVVHLVLMYHSIFTHSTINRHVDCSWLWGFKLCCSEHWSWMCMYPSDHTLELPGNILRSKINGSAYFCFNVTRKCQNAFLFSLPAATSESPHCHFSVSWRMGLVMLQ